MSTHRLLASGRSILVVAAMLLAAAPVLAQEGDPADAQETRQFLYRLKLVPRLLEPSAWTEADHEVVAIHFERLQELRAEGKLILAGRTLNEDETQFGLVILEVGSEAEARELMETDPAVTGGVMTATLFPYRVALIRPPES